jgi:hypothetical protein
MENKVVNIHPLECVGAEDETPFALNLESRWNANIYFNIQCLDQKVIPEFARLKMPHTSPSSLITQRKENVLSVYPL